MTTRIDESPRASGIRLLYQAHGIYPGTAKSWTRFLGSDGRLYREDSILAFGRKDGSTYRCWWFDIGAAEDAAPTESRSIPSPTDKEASAEMDEQAAAPNLRKCIRVRGATAIRIAATWADGATLKTRLDKSPERPHCDELRVYRTEAHLPKLRELFTAAGVTFTEAADRWRHLVIKEAT